jgi:hypothetical protein
MGEDIEMNNKYHNVNKLKTGNPVDYQQGHCPTPICTAIRNKLKQLK